TGHHVARRGGRQSHLFLRAQQDHVRQGGLDRVADASATLGGGGGGVVGFAGLIRLRRTQVAQVGGAHHQFAGERAPQRLVGGDQGLQALVDLAVLALATRSEEHTSELQSREN